MRNYTNIHEKKQQTASNLIAAQFATNKSNFYHQDNRPHSVIQKKQVDELGKKFNQLPLQKKENNTGLPNQLKLGIENLSGHSMDDVKVHYNSNKPAQLNALAYAQGTDIHIASGQEKHLPHEAWHIVQQKQGRVKPTAQLKGQYINDNRALEKEADVMGGKANTSVSQLKQRENTFQRLVKQNSTPTRSDKIVQRILNFSIGDTENLERVKALFNQAYMVGLQPEHPEGGLIFTAGVANRFGQVVYTITEANRSIAHDGIGAHLIGKIIDDGNVNIYFGEDRNDASPTNPDASDRGESSGGQIFLATDCTAIQLIHELIHTYHFAFDAWTAAQKNEQVTTGRGDERESAEEVSTTGIGAWRHFALTENAFRERMGLPFRDRYAGWEEP